MGRSPLIVIRCCNQGLEQVYDVDGDSHKIEVRGLDSGYAGILYEGGLTSLVGHPRERKTLTRNLPRTKPPLEMHEIDQLSTQSAL